MGCLCGVSTVTSQSSKRKRAGGEGHDATFRRHRDRHRPVRAGAGASSRQGRQAGCDRRAQALRRHLRQQWLHPHQEPDRERTRGARGAPRGRFRRGRRGPGPGRHEGGQGEEGCHRASLERGRRGGAARGRGHHRVHRSCALRRPRRGRGRRRSADRRAGLHQCRRPRRHPADPRARPGALAGQFVDDGRRFSALASRDPGRQLHRPRVRPDVPALRQRGHDHPAQRATGPARGSGHRAGDSRDPGGRGHPHPDRCRCDADR